MATITKTRGRTPVAKGKVLFGWTKGNDVESYSVTVDDEIINKFFSLNMSRNEAERLHAWLGKRLGC